MELSAVTSSTEAPRLTQRPLVVVGRSAVEVTTVPPAFPSGPAFPATAARAVSSGPETTGPPGPEMARARRAEKPAVTVLPVTVETGPAYSLTT